MQILAIIDDDKQKDLIAITLEKLPTVDDEIRVRDHDMTVMQIIELEGVASYQHAIVVRQAIKLSNLL
ncbi:MULTISPECIES: hypothetical protein [Halomonadaceae]|uniref:hypothetical protein n=1 Tax=Halomonadaceae TaxID=28256 RepID=UPI0015998844|nr:MULTISPECIES: hypothetical protein [Halomonas]QJQ96760.1 hypothetical protein HIO72_16725 [Halomonas sp. PA5]